MLLDTTTTSEECNGTPMLSLPSCFAPRRTMRAIATEIRDNRRFLGGTMPAFMACVQDDEWSRVLSVMATADDLS
jgi:hypothetical protein